MNENQSANGSKPATEQQTTTTSTINPRPRAWAMNWDGAALAASSGSKTSNSTLKK